MQYKKQMLVILPFLAVIVLIQCTKSIDENYRQGITDNSLTTDQSLMAGHSLVSQGKQTFRFDAFGDEDFWSGLLHLDKAIAGAKNGGFGTGVSPTTALAVGLKVDAAALPPEVVAGIQSGTVDLNDPATTLALLKLNAVVGVKGNFSTNGTLQSIGITCASCHSTVDNSFAPGIGKRLDGWPNRDLNVGAIISLT